MWLLRGLIPGLKDLAHLTKISYVKKKQTEC